jgi:hypothetical protein
MDLQPTQNLWDPYGIADSVELNLNFDLSQDSPGDPESIPSLERIGSANLPGSSIPTPMTNPGVLNNSSGVQKEDITYSEYLNEEFL